jgi:site-specific recombinase XerD
MKFSIKLKINHRRVQKNGEAALYFQVIIDDVVTSVAVDLKWSPDHFDKDLEMITPKSKGDSDYHDYLLMIEGKRKEILEVIKFYRLANRKLTAQILKDELSNAKSREDFIVFWKSMIKKRFAKGVISEQTRKNNNSSLKMLERFQAEVRFNEINEAFLSDYQAFIKRQKSPTGKTYRINTVAKYLTDLKCYLTFAQHEGIIFDDPFKNKSIATTRGSILYLNKEELRSVWHYFNSDECSDVHRMILRPFLFSCFTGLRHSDLERVTHKDIKNKDLIFEPYKTRELQKEVIVPLCSTALQLIDTAKGNLFKKVYSNQKVNERLKEVAEKCNIYKNLSTHVARHTFATQFLEMGGKIEVLKELLGHSKMETTMVYVHVTTEQKRKQISLMNDIF